MFDIGKKMRGCSKASRTRTQLRCEELDQRVVPTTANAILSFGGHTGMVELIHSVDVIDPESSSQSISATLMGFGYKNTLYNGSNIVGTAIASYEYGEFSGFQFSVDSQFDNSDGPVAVSAAPSGDSISGTVSYDDFTLGPVVDPFVADVVDKKVSFDFSSVTTNQAYTLQIIHKAGLDTVTTININVEAGASAKAIRDAVEGLLASQNIATESTGDHKLTIGKKHPGNTWLTSLEIKTIQNGQVNPDLKAPRLFHRIGAPPVKVNGQDVTPSSPE